MTDGPHIEALVRRLAATPAEFLAEPRLTRGGDVCVDAVVHDVLADLGHQADPARLVVFANREPTARNWLRLVLIGAWLAHDPWFRARADLGPAIERWLTENLAEHAGLVDAGLFVSDTERREEFARWLLHCVGVVPAGESPHQAADRLRSVDSVERARVLDLTRAQRARAEELRRALQEERAREAAARYSRE